MFGVNKRILLYLFLQAQELLEAVTLLKTPDNNDDDKGGISGGAIAGIVIGVIAAIIVAVIIVVKCRNRPRVPNNQPVEQEAAPPPDNLWYANNITILNRN